MQNLFIGCPVCAIVRAHKVYADQKLVKCIPCRTTTPYGFKDADAPVIEDVANPSVNQTNTCLGNFGELG